MRPPLEYGDNFPVPPGAWNPAVPWRFPNTEIRPGRPSVLRIVLPWLTLGIGVTLGILWMNWRTEEEPALQDAVSTATEGQDSSFKVPKEMAPPVPKPDRMRSELA